MAAGGGGFQVLKWGLVTEPLIPAPEELAAELVGMLRTGVTTQQLRRCPAILGLAVTKAKAASESPNDVAVAAHTLLREAAARADDEASGAAAMLLGLAPGSRGALLKDRRRRAAEALHVSPEHFRKEREPLLLEAVADELYAADSAYRLRQSNCQMLWIGADVNQAATFSSVVVSSSSVTRSPSLYFAPASTSATSSWPLTRRQRSWAASSSL
jgi:hypothetical protein